MIVYPQIILAYPKGIATTNEKDTYNIKIRGLTKVHTATIAVKVVVGCIIKKYKKFPCRILLRFFEAD